MTFFSSNLVASDIKKIRLQLPDQISYRFAGYIAAIEQGYYQDIGLEVLLENTATLAALNSKQTNNKSPNFMLGSTQILLDNNKGSSFVVLANFLQKSPFIFLSSKENGITSLFDIANSPISFGEPDLQGRFANNLIEASVTLKAMGVYPQKLNNRDASWNIDQLIEKNSALIPSLLTTGPYFLKQKMIQPIIIKPEAYGISLFDDVLYANQEFIDSNPELVDGFIKATIKGWQFALDYPQDLIEVIMNDYQPVDSLFDADFLAQESLIIAQLMQQDVVEIGHINTEKWQKIAQLFYELKFINNPNIDGLLYRNGLSSAPSRMSDFVNFSIAFSVLLMLFCFYIFFDNKKYQRIIKQQESEGKMLRKFAEKDSLTSLDNRHKLNITLEKLYQESCNLETEYCLIVIDIDKFKEFNDSYGHLAGDAVLISLAQRTGRMLRTYDSFARFGGEEFVITLPNTSRAMGLVIAQRILDANRVNLVHYDKNILSYTVSIGVASSRPADKTPLEILARADKYLYQAKDKGRDRVCNFDNYQQKNVI